MQEVEQRRERLPRMRAAFAVVCPHPGPLPQGEGEKRCALFGDRISKNEDPARPSLRARRFRACVGAAATATTTCRSSGRRAGQPAVWLWTSRAFAPGRRTRRTRIPSTAVKTRIHCQHIGAVSAVQHVDTVATLEHVVLLSTLARHRLHFRATRSRRTARPNRWQGICAFYLR
jgi:hypothetical protein